MGKTKQLILGIAGVLTLLTSCNDDILNVQPLDSISSDATWGDEALSQAFVFNIYSGLGYGGFEEEGLASLTDDAMFTHAGRGLNVITEGTISPSNLGNTRVLPTWDELYSAIRDANIAITSLPEATFDNQTVNDRLMGESLFLRAYYYHQLMRTYGGVPLIDRPYELNEDYSIARATLAETVTFIITDLDRAITLLTDKGYVRGRASELSAMALKSRVLTYAASDLFDGPTVTGASSAHASYSNLDLVAYTSGDRNARWNAAKTASKALLDEAMGYKLDLAAPESAEDATQNYVSLAMGGQSAVGDAAAAVELLFERTHTPLYTEEDAWPLGGINVGINNGPNGYHNWAGNTPIQHLVDDYEMMDGSTFDWGNPAHAADPYANRDPRLYATVLYDGAGWKPRPSDVVSIDPADQIQTGRYDLGNGEYIAGVDTRQSVIEDWNGSRTGYYVRKFIDPDPAKIDNLSDAQTVPWPFLRYTEIVFNYVEACINLEEYGEAQTWLNKIRFRAGLTATTETGDDLLNRFIRDKRVEMCYEEQRFYDARRWLIAPTTLGRGIKVMTTQADLKAGASPNQAYTHDKAVYDYTYTVVDNTDNETRSWDDKLYFMPISRDEMNKNELLEQNPGY